MKIAFIGQPEYFRFCYENDLDRDFEVKEFPFHFGMAPNELKDVIDFGADYNIFFRGEFFPEEVLHELSGVKIALSSEPFPRYIKDKLVYTFDSWKRYSDFRNRIRNKRFDHVFHYDDASLEFMRRDGLSLSGGFAFPVATSVYQPLDVPKLYDFFFIGRSTQHREKFFGSLKHHFNFLHICHGIYGPPLLPYICQAKINLNVHAENEISWEPRMQMLLSCGAFVISEPLTPNSYLRPDQDYVVARNPAEFFEKSNHFLKNDSDREKIAKSGLDRVRDILDSKKNFMHLFQQIARGEFAQFHSTAPAIKYDAWVNIYKALEPLHRAGILK